MGHHSLVTSIDWKQYQGDLTPVLFEQSPLAGDIY